MGKVAISLAIGPLHKWGYQHVCQECMASQAEFADHIYVVQSTEDSTGVEEFLSKYSNVTFISNPSTWHHRPGETDEILTTSKKMTGFHMHNLIKGRLAAFRDGYKIVLSTHNNWYIPRRGIGPLHDYIDKFQATSALTGRMWRFVQLNDTLFGPGARGDFLCNLAGMDEAGIQAYYPRLKWERALGRNVPDNINDVHIVDCMFELYPEEFGAMQERFPDYHTPKGAWDWPKYLEYRVSRFKRFAKIESIPLDYWGQRIADKSQPGFASHYILRELGLSKTIGIDVVIRRAIDCNSMLYNRKRKCPEAKRAIQLRFLYELAGQAPDGTAVECGVYHGGSFVCWSGTRLGRGPLIAVDNWADKNRDAFMANLKRYPDLRGTTILEMETCEAPAAIEGQVAFCFIDAGHYETGIARDILVWPNKIMPGGILAFHDYSSKGGVVGRCVDEWQKRDKWESLGAVGTIIAFRKPR